jgi:choline kinase
MWLEEEKVVRNAKHAVEGCLSHKNIEIDQVSLVSISWADLDTKEDWQNAWKVIEKVGLKKRIQ